MKQTIPKNGSTNLNKLEIVYNTQVCVENLIVFSIAEIITKIFVGIYKLCVWFKFAGQSMKFE